MIMESKIASWMFKYENFNIPFSLAYLAFTFILDTIDSIVIFSSACPLENDVFL